MCFWAWTFSDENLRHDQLSLKLLRVSHDFFFQTAERRSWRIVQLNIIFWDTLWKSSWVAWIICSFQFFVTLKLWNSVLKCQSFEISGFCSFEVSGSRVLRFLGIMVSGFQGILEILILWSLNIRKTET
jgi:hypothetical protein